MDGKPAAELEWRRGRHCDIGNCVEVAALGEAVVLRSSTNTKGTHLAISRQEWAEFLAAVKVGDFDGLFSV